MQKRERVALDFDMIQLTIFVVGDALQQDKAFPYLPAHRKLTVVHKMVFNVTANAI